jgi:phosphate-selective porin OprO/OprP
MTNFTRTALAAAAALLLSAGHAAAQEQPTPAAGPAPAPAAAPAAPADQSLEARLAALEKKAAEPPKAAFPEVKLGGVVQADGRVYDDSAAQPLVDTILLRRVRLDTTARVTPGLSARVQLDVAGGILQTLDAYADARWIPGVALRAGKFTPPVGIERLVSTPALLFIEYAQTSNLVPNRDVGLQASGDVGTWLSWAVGAFDGAGDGFNNDVDASDDKDLVARLALRPVGGLTLHLAGSHGTRAGTAAAPLLPSYRSEAQGVVYFRYAATAAAVGEHTRLTAAASWYVGGLGLLGEYVASRQRVVNTTAAAPPVVTEARPTNTAWQVAASYVLTGEKNGEGVVKPATTVEAGGLGAVRVKARYQELDVDDDLFVGNVFASASASATKAAGYNVGLDWWPVAPLRFELEYSHTAFDGGGGSAASVADKPSETAFLSRVQVVF